MDPHDVRGVRPIPGLSPTELRQILQRKKQMATTKQRVKFLQVVDKAQDGRVAEEAAETLIDAGWTMMNAFPVPGYQRLTWCLVFTKREAIRSRKKEAAK